MCLIHFHFQKHPKYKLIVAANRDEFYERPTEAAHFWPDAPYLLAGRDLLKKGTWLGITKEGRFAALTNIRDLTLEKERNRSRGSIVSEFLTSNDSPELFLEKLRKEKDSYPGFNILIGNENELFHYNNVRNIISRVTPGTHSLSNDTLNTPWPKTAKGRERLNDYLLHNDSVNEDALFNIMEDKEIAPDSLLPDTGVGLELERKLSASFIKIPNYGTRSITVLLIDRNNHITFRERTYIKGIFDSEQAFSFFIPNQL